MIAAPYLELALLSIILLLGIALVFAVDYMKSIIVVSIISVLAAATYLIMAAPDVALTEAAVGACASSCVLLVGLRYLKGEKPIPHKWWQLSFCVGVCLALLIAICYYSIGLHQYGDPAAIIKGGASHYYISNIEKDIGIRSLVTAILASYRGMDTFCETLVIFTAGMCVVFIFGYSSLKPNKEKGGDEKES